MIDICSLEDKQDDMEQPLYHMLLKYISRNLEK